jgi:hypothetical protein
MAVEEVAVGRLVQQHLQPGRVPDLEPGATKVHMPPLRRCQERLATPIPVEYEEEYEAWPWQNWSQTPLQVWSIRTGCVCTSR